MTTHLTVVNKDKGLFHLAVLPGKSFQPYEYVSDLIDQLKGDIFPLLESQIGLFTIARNIFCFTDHIASLMYIHTGKKQTERIKIVLNDFMPYDKYVNSKYKRYRSYLVQVYRHDLVHNVRPLPHIIDTIRKGATRKDRQESWFFQSNYLKHDAPKSLEELSEYFKIAKNRKGYCHLRYHRNEILVNNFCLFFDLINYLQDLKEKLRTDSNLQEIFANNYQKIVDNYWKIKDYILDKNKDEECK
ncbi:hypothetical protein JW796_02690 [Candidatus Dojkabacteria bacterium]|nr:hypothetical protein [Candidatus Dojkabacteria bacterium]